jgi:hypothetical protein
LIALLSILCRRSAAIIRLGAIRESESSLFKRLRRHFRFSSRPREQPHLSSRSAERQAYAIDRAPAAFAPTHKVSRANDFMGLAGPLRNFSRLRRRPAAAFDLARQGAPAGALKNGA